MTKPQKVALVTDSSCDLSEEQLAEYGIRLISLRVVCSTGEYRDRIEINTDTLYKLMEKELPKSSLPLPEDVSLLYDDLKDEGYTHVLHFSISSGLSGTYNMVRMVAEERTDMEIHVIDSLTLSTGLGSMVIKAAKTLQQTGSIDEAIASAKALRSTQLGVFIIKTLEFLRKGGRIGLVEGVVGSILQLKPIIFVNDDGIYQTLAKARGYANAIDTMLREIVTRFKGKKISLSVVHGAAADEAKKLLDKLKSVLDITDSFITQCSPVLGIHTGPGLLGIIAHED